MRIFDKIIGKKEEKKKAVEKPKKISDINSEREEEKKEKPVQKKAPEMPKKKKPSGKKKVKKEDNTAYGIIIEQIISEKSTTLGIQNKYVFKVRKDASKFQIKEAVEGYYAVTVTSVNTIKISPKKRIQGRTIGWKKGFKKAIVTLQEGDTIAAAEGV
jgi:large subunit ribosomal protein L23